MGLKRGFQAHKLVAGVGFEHRCIHHQLALFIIQRHFADLAAEHIGERSDQNKGLLNDPGRSAFQELSPADFIRAQRLRATLDERIQSYIRKGIEEGAEVLVGGEGHPKGLEAGYFVKPTVFVNVKNDMTIAREEIFGPVLSVIAYENEEDAIRIANDTNFGLYAFVSGTDVQRARRVASLILAGRVAINGMLDDQQAPFGGFKHSGVGREFGTFGIEAFLEPRAILE
jgi:hypothetical protein